jgi:hypothetical protein
VLDSPRLVASVLESLVLEICYPAAASLQGSYQLEWSITVPAGSSSCKHYWHQSALDWNLFSLETSVKCVLRAYLDLGKSYCPSLCELVPPSNKT